jgi:enoyl-CoA hydratase
MSYETIRVEKRGAVAAVVMDRAKALNALNAAMFAELDAVFGELAADDEVRVVLLTGAGERAFAAGADIRELDAVGPGEGQGFALRGQAVFRKIETLGKPVIACVRGFALGGGCELAMACTLRVAAEDAKFGQPEVKLGVIPGYGGSQRLPRLVGRGAALKMLLTGAAIDAQEALRIGLVDEGLDLPLEKGLALEAEAFGKLCDSADKAEGTRAFLEKRRAEWGRERS